MIAKPNGYDASPVYGLGEAEQVTPGGHICQIKSVRVETDNNNERTMVIAFDLAERDSQAGYYQRKFASRQDQGAKWTGVYRQRMDGKGTPYFKGLITSIEKSNNFTWNWEEATLKGKLFGGIFRREEFIGQDGQPHWSSKICMVRDVEAALAAEPPADKPLSDRPAAPAPVVAPATSELPF